MYKNEINQVEKLCTVHAQTRILYFQMFRDATFVHRFRDTT